MHKITVFLCTQNWYSMQIVPVKHLSQTWLKASVVGSIWASIEIILGSFLHNLKIPFSGVVLSFISVWLLISFLQVWKENGLIWRAGIICALMKSISPSAFIIGPMIGIFSEALLIEAFIFLLGKNLLGYAIGGAFAILSTIFQKIASLLILYGFDFIKILSDLYLFSVKQINLEKLSPAFLITLIIIIYTITGITGAVAGYFSGIKYLKAKSNTVQNYVFDLNSENKLADQGTRQTYSSVFLLINLLSIVAILLLLNFNFLIPASISSCVYIVFSILKYKNSLKRLKKISFWLSFIIITFAAAFLWNGFANGAFFSMAGLIIGLKMNMRAIILVIGFASISVELKNPVIKSVLYNKGFANLYQSINLAFSALPFFLSNFTRQGKRKISGNSFRNILSQAENLLEIFETEHKVKPQILIITGEIHQGKTTFTQKVVSALLEDGIKIAGFFALGTDRNGERTGFNLVSIESSEAVELCSEKEDINKVKFGKYYFNPEAICFGNGILNDENVSGKQLIVIDEIGPLELVGKGWSDTIERLTRKYSIPQLWVVRKSLVEKVSRRWSIGNAYIFDISTSTIPEVQNKLKEIMSK